MSHIENKGINPLPLSVGEIYDHNTDNQFGTGYGHTELAKYPFPKIYHRATLKEEQLRDEELAAAKADNWYNYDLIPGAVVHGNVAADQVNNNRLWTLRGSKDNRQAFAKEDQFGRDDSDPGDSGVDIYESLFYYFDRNWELWASNTEALNNINRLLSVVTENLTD
ncbi:hypothetical protein, partial [Zhongshania sp.]|uniref:hypothetical protein n=1 Tax=Zhongshania sp. TaxID=1971902 RepID=UPI00356A21CE